MAEHLEFIADVIIEQIKTAREEAVIALLTLCRSYLQRLVNSNKKRVCRLFEGQQQCDATNLGCFIQAVPELCKSQVEDCVYSGTVANLLSQMQNISWHGAQITYTQSRPRYNTGSHAVSHAGCGLSQVMASELEAIKAFLPGISLPS